MKRVFLLFVEFIVVCFMADRIAGALLFSAYSKSNVMGKYEKCDAEIVVLGSSRAKHHYVPSIIGDSLDMSCYNLGQDGKNIYYQYASMNLLLQQHKPKVVVYDCFSVDVLKSPTFAYDWGTLVDFDPYYGRNDSLDALIRNMGIKHTASIVASHIYRNNTRFLDYFNRRASIYSGYEPVYGKYTKSLAVHYENEGQKLDLTKIEYMHRLINLCRNNGIEIVFAISPRFALNEEPDAPITRKYIQVKELCEKTHTPFLYYELDTLFMNHQGWFKDVGHLNDNGAHVFSGIFAHDLKQVLTNQIAAK